MPLPQRIIMMMERRMKRLKLLLVCRSKNEWRHVQSVLECLPRQKRRTTIRREEEEESVTAAATTIIRREVPV